MRFHWFCILSTLAVGTVLFSIAVGFGQSSDPARNEARGGDPQMANVLVVERDVPQTRTNAFVPVINHESLVANLSDRAIEVSIESPVPDGFYRVKQFYPAFGQESLLAVPMFFPDKISIANYTILERPTVETKNSRVRYIWPKVQIKPGHAAIAQYDNYLGRLARFFDPKGLRLLELSLATDYKVSLDTGGKIVSFDLQWRMRNEGKEDIEDIVIDHILPDTVHSLEGKPDTIFFSIHQLSHSDGIKASRGMLGDGFGNPATGSIFVINSAKLKAGESAKFWVKVQGEKMADTGRIWPLVTVQCRMKGERIWPASIFKSPAPLQIKSFYYRQCNLTLPDAQIFHLEPGSVKVQKAEVKDKD